MPLLMSTPPTNDSGLFTEVQDITSLFPDLTNVYASTLIKAGWKYLYICTSGYQDVDYYGGTPMLIPLDLTLLGLILSVVHSPYFFVPAQSNTSATTNGSLSLRYVSSSDKSIVFYKRSYSSTYPRNNVKIFGLK